MVFQPEGLVSIGGADALGLLAVAAAAGVGMEGTGSSMGGHVGSFDLRPCLGTPLLLSARDASVSELLDASQQQIHCMESTLASMLQVAKRWTDGGFEGGGDSLRGRFTG
jgi:hypothetical protein